MPLNTNIAMSGQPVQIANPMDMYGKMASIQNAQNQNTLAQYQLGAAQRAEAKDISRTNALAQAGTDDTAIANALLRSGDVKGYSDFLKSRTDQSSASTKLLSDKLSLLPEAYKRADTPEAYLTLHQSVHADPILGPWLKSTGATPEKGLATLQNAVQTGKFDELRMGSMQSVAQVLEGMKPMVVSPGASVFQGGKSVFTAPAAPAAAPTPLNVSRLIKERDALPKGDPNIAIYNDAIRKETQFAPRPITNVNMPPQQGAFEGELGKGQAKSIIDSRAAAQDAASIIDTVNIGRDILKGGVITGAGADFFVNFNQALKTAGVDFGYADAAANSQAYAANMAQNVGKLIKQFGAGTGLSDADRQYAEKMAGGKITLDAKALNKILDINERAARNVITRHNKDVEGVKAIIPLKVEMPAKRAEPVAVVTAPPVAIEYLRANPSMKNAFDAKYGAGAADRALKGQ